jgi:predicted GNAT family acetyltransferase
MAAVVDLCREQWQNVTLYVNDFNTTARALYRRVGFDEVGALATVLY